jgi:hypothetical protein
MLNTSDPDDFNRFGRRSTLRAGLAAMAAVAMASQAHANDENSGRANKTSGGTGLPVSQMDDILQAQGKSNKNVVGYSFARTDLHASLPGGINVVPAELLSGDLYFQSIGNQKAIMNADFCLTAEETNKFIDALLANGLMVQAFHQHLADITPMAWFIHVRGQNDPITLAKAVASAIQVTATPLPQPKPPADNATPFDKNHLASILGGDPTVHAHGVLEIGVDRADRFTLAGQQVSPDLNIAINVYFQPLDQNGNRALAVPDFGMVAQEINPVLRKMRSQNWRVGCLYNQETDENPQLFWSHMWKTGTPAQLAREIRDGLGLCNMQFKSRS